MSKIRYFHEDDYCQVEILPVENLSFYKRQAREIEDFADEHREGVGFTDMYVREKKPIPLFEKS